MVDYCSRLEILFHRCNDIIILLRVVLQRAQGFWLSATAARGARLVSSPAFVAAYQKVDNFLNFSDADT